MRWSGKSSSKTLREGVRQIIGESYYKVETIESVKILNRKLLDVCEEL